jgi:hypothetical protein
VVLGFDSLTPYQDGTSPYFGAIVGRVANRIAGAAFSLNGKQFVVSANERGNCLHGGNRGFDKRWWKAEPLQTPEGEALRLTYTSPNGALAPFRCQALRAVSSLTALNQPQPLRLYQRGTRGALRAVSSLTALNQPQPLRLYQRGTRGALRAVSSLTRSPASCSRAGNGRRAGEEGFPGTMKVVVTYTVATHGEHAFGDASLVRRTAL